MLSGSITHEKIQERGANLVEMALIVPLLILLLVAVSDLGRAYFTYITMINAAREGARWAVDHSCDQSGMVARARAEAQASGVDLGPATIEVDGLCAGSGDPVTVRVSLNFQAVLGGLLGSPTFPIRTHATFAAR